MNIEEENPRKKRKQKVIWTEDELNSLAEMAANSYMNHPGMPMTKIINSVQNMIPPNRRRKVISFTTVPNLMVRIKQKLLQIKEQSKKSQLPPEKIYIETTPEEVIDQLTSIDLFMITLRRLFNELSYQNEKINMIEELVKNIKISNIPVSGHNHPNDDKKTNHPKLKIAVLGLYKHQFQEVESKFSRIENLVFRYIDRSNLTIKLPQLDFLFIAKRFIKHEWQEIAYSQLHRDKVILVDGATSNIIKEINQLLKNLKIIM